VSIVTPPVAQEHGRGVAKRFSRRTTPTSDLLAELEVRANDFARFQVDLESGDYSDGDTDQLRGGIAYERSNIEAIVSELEARERARARGYCDASSPSEPDLAARFAAAKAIDSADVLREETGQDGRRSGDRWVFTCPFHLDSTPSLTAYPGERGWHCFACGRGGDAVALLAELKCIGAVEALRMLESGLLGVQVMA
jgi:hypothetical protein